MASWSPPKAPREWVVGIGLLYLLVLVYAFLIVQQILLAVIIGVVFGGLYLVWRMLTALEAIAEATQRIADQGERE